MDILDKIDTLQMSEKLLACQRSADNFSCDACTKELKVGKAWYANREKNLDYCGKCAKNIDLAKEEIVCLHDGVTQKVNPWVQFRSFDCNNYDSWPVFLNAVPDRDMMGIVPDEAIMAEWYKFMHMVFTEDPHWYGGPDMGEMSKNIRGWVPLAFKNPPTIEEKDLSCKSSHRVPTFLCVNCNRGAPKYQLATFSFDRRTNTISGGMENKGVNVQKYLDEWMPALMPVKTKY